MSAQLGFIRWRARPCALVATVGAALALVACGSHPSTPSVSSSSVTATAAPEPEPNGPFDRSHQDAAIAAARSYLLSTLGTIHLEQPDAHFVQQYDHPQMPGQPEPRLLYGWVVSFHARVQADSSLSPAGERILGHDLPPGVEPSEVVAAPVGPGGRAPSAPPPMPTPLQGGPGMSPRPGVGGPTPPAPMPEGGPRIAETGAPPAMQPGRLGHAPSLAPGARPKTEGGPPPAGIAYAPPPPNAMSPMMHPTLPPPRPIPGIGTTTAQPIAHATGARNLEIGAFISVDGGTKRTL